MGLRVTSCEERDFQGVVADYSGTVSIEGAQSKAPLASSFQ